MQEYSTNCVCKGALHQPSGTRALESCLVLGLESLLLARVWVWRTFSA